MSNRPPKLLIEGAREIVLGAADKRCPKGFVRVKGTRRCRAKVGSKVNSQKTKKARVSVGLVATGDCADARADGHTEGYARGYEEGYNEGCSNCRESKPSTESNTALDKQYVLKENQKRCPPGFKRVGKSRV